MAKLSVDSDLGALTRSLPQKDVAGLSYSDVRRLAALRSKDRLRDLIRRQEKSIPTGRWRLSECQHDSLVPTLSPAHWKALHSMWEQVVKFVNISGPHMLNYLEQNCEVAVAVLEARENRRCHRRPQFGPLVDLERKRLMGRLLVFHITDLLANLRHRNTLRELVDKKLDILLNMGFTPDILQSLSAAVVQYLHMNYPRHWNRTVEQACNIVLKCLRLLGNDHLETRGQFSEDYQFKDTVTNIIYNPRVSN